MYGMREEQEKRHQKRDSQVSIQGVDELQKTWNVLRSNDNLPLLWKSCISWGNLNKKRLYYTYWRNQLLPNNHKTKRTRKRDQLQKVIQSLHILYMFCYCKSNTPYTWEDTMEGVLYFVQSSVWKFRTVSFMIPYLNW